MISTIKRTPIYRFLHLSNLSTCLERGGLFAPNHTPSDGKTYKTIHDSEIQNIRISKPIPCGPKGVIHDYVPFYFSVRSPMLYRLNKGTVEGYNEGQEPLIYLTTHVDAVIESNLRFVFSDGHGISSLTAWYDNVSKLDQVDWDVVQTKYWADTPENPDRQRRKQAEFLIHKFCPWNVIQKIGVYSDSALSKVQSILSSYSIDTPISVEKAWYYS